ncbi:helix-turn-helix domain-containing protein [Alkalihalobacillus sp. BA299]|uniref:helix-turn-helix domain-containing protein n=1 Tax=Alkalihalobacillus sp. BA299 TaxID=2815938 RepID=UPI001AD9D001|nr:helix-turn-helix domain-containing protein [Alkalihalobacillus sp. BA299]
MESDKKRLTTGDVAKLLEVTEHTVYNYIKQNKIVPFNKDTWHWDGQYFFYEEDINVDTLVEKKPGKTTGEVAKELGVSQTTVLKYINSGELEATLQSYKGRDMYFIADDEVKRFIENYSKQKKYEKKSFYSKETGYCLFQLFFNSKLNKVARIKEISNEGIIALTEDGRTVEINELKSEGFNPAYIIEEGKYNTKKGHAKFRFTKPRQIKSTTYKIIDLFYQSAGPLNIRLFEEEDMIEIEIKPTLIEIDRQEFMDEINMLQQSLIEGNVSIRHNGVLIDSDLEVLQLYLPSDLKAEIKKRAERQNITMDELMLEVVRKEFQRDYEK